MYWLIAAFVISFFFVGVPYWQIPYAKVSLPITLYGMGLLVVGVLAAAARAFGKARLLMVILAVGAAGLLRSARRDLAGEQESVFLILLRFGAAKARVAIARLG